MRMRSFLAISSTVIVAKRAPAGAEAAAAVDADRGEDLLDLGPGHDPLFDLLRGRVGDVERRAGGISRLTWNSPSSASGKNSVDSTPVVTSMMPPTNEATPMRDDQPSASSGRSRSAARCR